MKSTTSEAFFEDKYRASEDPWEFAKNSYELSRYEAILRLLGDRMYRLAFEPGCSVGVLTEKLATRCERVDAYDISPTAVKRARDRCMQVKNVNIYQASLRDCSPAGADLYLLCEVGYYMTKEELGRLLEEHLACLGPHAVVVGCHWLGFSPDHVIGGDEVHEAIQGVPMLVHQYGERHEGFRLDRWVKQ